MSNCSKKDVEFCIYELNRLTKHSIPGERMYVHKRFTVGNFLFPTFRMGEHTFRSVTKSIDISDYLIVYLAKYACGGVIGPSVGLILLHIVWKAFRFQPPR